MKTSLSENLRLGLSRNDPVIRAINIVVLLVLLGICLANAGCSTPPAPHAAAPSSQPTASLEQQIAQLQQANQYLSVLAERNEMAVRLLQANARADDLQKQLDAEKAKHAAPEKKEEEKK